MRIRTGVSEAKAFIGLCRYYRTWIKQVAQKSEPIFKLFRKKTQFAWGKDQQEAIDIMKTILRSSPVIRPIDYMEVPER